MGQRIIGAVATVAGFTIAFFLVWRPWSLARSAERWNEVECSIVSSKMKEISGSDAPPSYVPEVVYSYTFNGKQYQSERYFLVGWGRSEGTVSGIISKHPIGAKCRAYVNPIEPTEAVLDRKFRLNGLFVFLSIGFLAFGTMLLLADE